jgi:hypothetical protein
LAVLTVAVDVFTVRNVIQFACVDIFALPPTQTLNLTQNLPTVPVFRGCERCKSPPGNVSRAVFSCSLHARLPSSQSWFRLNPVPVRRRANFAMALPEFPVCWVPIMLLRSALWGKRDESGSINSKSDVHRCRRGSGNTLQYDEGSANNTEDHRSRYNVHNDSAVALRRQKDRVCTHWTCSCRPGPDDHLSLHVEHRQTNAVSPASKPGNNNNRDHTPCRA